MQFTESDWIRPKLTESDMQFAESDRIWQVLLQMINMPIVSHHPSSNELLTAWTCRVVGHGVKDMATDVKVLWSSTTVPSTAATFRANHFVVLHPTSQPQQVGNVINLTAVSAAAQQGCKRVRITEPPARFLSFDVSGDASVMLRCMWTSPAAECSKLPSGQSWSQQLMQTICDEEYVVLGHILSNSVTLCQIRSDWVRYSHFLSDSISFGQIRSVSVNCRTASTQCK